MFFAEDKIEHKDETVQCSCGHTKDISTLTDIEAMANSESKNPLVVISVFKKHRGQDQSDFDIKIGEGGDVKIVENKQRNSELPIISPKKPENPRENIEINPDINTKRNTDKNIKAKSTLTARNASPSLRSPITSRPANTNQNYQKDVKLPTSSPPPRHIPRPNDISPLRSRTFVKENETLLKDVKGSATSPSPRYIPRPRNDTSPERNRTFIKENESSLKDTKGSVSSPSPRYYILKPRNDTSPVRNRAFVKENEKILKSDANNLKPQNIALVSLPERNKFSNKPEHKSERNKLVTSKDLSPEINKLVTRLDVSPVRNNMLARTTAQNISMKTKEIGKPLSPYAPWSTGKQKTLVTEKNKAIISFGTEKTMSPRKIFNVLKEEKPDQIKSTNMDSLAAKTKKSLVDTFTKKITEKITPKKTEIAENEEERTRTGAESTGSRVTVNIDAENEYYDLLFHHDSDTTDLSIRKKKKYRGSPKLSLEYHHENLSASLENFLVSAEDNERKRSVSQTWNNDHVSKCLSMCLLKFFFFPVAREF